MTSLYNTERIRANILEKKNRLLGREAKSRRKGLSSLEVGNNLAVSAQASTSSALVRGAPATDDRQNGTQFTAHTRRFTEEKNVKSALYKPTFLCMAAIETPGALSHRLEKQDNSSTSASEGTVECYIKEVVLIIKRAAFENHNGEPKWSW